MKAVVVQKERSVKVEQKAIPQPKANQVLIKIAAFGQNPTDWKHADMLAKEGDIIGCDATGVIASTGSAVPRAAGFQNGMRVGFFTRGGQSADHGAFAEYVAMDWDLVFKVPDNLSFEEAATIPIPFFTAVQALYLRLGMTEPDPEQPSTPSQNKWLLVWSGASAVGQYAVQLGKVSGYKVVTTASESNWPLLKSFGVDEVFDYKDPEVAQKIQKVTNDELELALDCVCNEESPSLIAKAMSSKKGGAIVCVLGGEEIPLPRADVKTIPTLLYTALTGKDEAFGDWVCAGSPADKEHYILWLEKGMKLFANGKIQTLPIEKAGGVDDVQKGFERMIAGKVKAQKLVYTI